ncbi:MAG: hypothetical protein CSA42_07085 [Gammaproteobacteria bacterium]|nr:MAG: hypothetical protein CSA42_07085 [Gammaproteobacteria bacterium]
MNKIIKQSVVASFIALSLVSFAATDFTIKKLDTAEFIQSAYSHDDINNLTTQEKIKLLAEKLRLSDFSVRAVDDKNFIDALSKTYAKKEVEKQCVFDKFDREDFKNRYSNYAVILMEENPEILNNSFEDLDFLAKLMNVFYEDDEEIIFNNGSLNDFLASPAFEKLTASDTERLIKIVQNKKNTSLLSVIGFPARIEPKHAENLRIFVQYDKFSELLNLNSPSKKAKLDNDLEYFDFSSFSFLNLYVYTALSAGKCGLNK